MTAIEWGEGERLAPSARQPACYLWLRAELRRPLVDLRRPLLLLLLLRELKLDRLGTLPPSRRASDRPMAIACLRVLTVFPEPPLFNVPRFILCTALLTLLDAFRPYLGIGIPSFRK